MEELQKIKTIERKKAQLSVIQIMLVLTVPSLVHVLYFEKKSMIEFMISSILVLILFVSIKFYKRKLKKVL